MSLKNSFKREDLFWYVTVWNLFIMSLPNAIQNKKIGLWILLGNLFLIAGICIYVVVYNKRNNIKLRKGSLPFLLIVFGFLVFVLWASGTLGRMFAPLYEYFHCRTLGSTYFLPTRGCFKLENLS